MELEEFHRLVGETIMFCQCIEHDIKLIYSGMLQGNFNKNYSSVETDTLGTIIRKLEKLDKSDGNPYFGKADYRLLKEITEIRNYWAHQGYIDFIYSGIYSKEFNDQVDFLKKDYDRLKNLHEISEKVRLEFFGINEDEDDG